MMKPEQRNTVRYLDAYAADAGQRPKHRLLRCIPECIKIKPPLSHIRRCRPHISAPVSQPAGRKSLIAQGKNLLRCREEIISSAGIDLLSRRLTEQLHALLDGWNILVLGDDEAHQHLPGILLKNPDSLSGIAGGVQKGVVLFQNPPSHRSVTGAEVKIIIPDIPVLFLRAGEPEFAVPQVPDSENMIPVKDPVCAGFLLHPAETLSAVGNPVQVQVVFNLNFHFCQYPVFYSEAPNLRSSSSLLSATPGSYPLVVYTPISSSSR